LGFFAIGPNVGEHAGNRDFALVVDEGVKLGCAFLGCGCGGQLRQRKAQDNILELHFGL
jgi:hypothetical protein